MPKMSNYPSAQDAIAGQDAQQPPASPSGQGAPAEGGMSKDNPVFSALRTVAQWVSTMQAKGDPQAQEAAAAFKSFLEALGAGAAGVGQEEAPAGAEAPAGPMPAKNMDSIGGGKGQAMGMGGMNKNAKVM